MATPGNPHHGPDGGVKTVSDLTSLMVENRLAEDPSLDPKKVRAQARLQADAASGSNKDFASLIAAEQQRANLIDQMRQDAE